MSLRHFSNNKILNLLIIMVLSQALLWIGVQHKHLDLEQEHWEKDAEDGFVVGDDGNSTQTSEALHSSITHAINVTNATNAPKDQFSEKNDTSKALSDLFEIDINIDMPKDLNILFIGDSLSRYQYLSLVYFLSYGKWIENDDRPNILLEKTFGSWAKYFNYSNGILQPKEKCDCYRVEGQFVPKRIRNTVENRYFYDIERNNSLVHLQKYGKWSFHSNWKPEDIHKQTQIKPLLGLDDLNFVYDSTKWPDIIKDYVCKLQPRPSIFIFNQGLWGSNKLEDPRVQSSIIKSLKDCGITSVYKTTTRWIDQNDTSLLDYEKELCNLTDYCFDLSWTGVLPPSMYWDRAHFLPIVYSWMNVKLLKLLNKINP